MSEELVVGVEPAALDVRAAPRVSSRARRRGAFVAGHQPPDVVGETPLQAAHRFVVGLPGGDFCVVVGPAVTAPHPDLGERDDVQRQVQLAVAAAREAVPGPVR